ncbi:hypothetical protein [Soonwooa sp.]|uniref:hypothetical protein n=1 Tax=Soonwooa sp. TaxID=1938592 RepID=UPI0026187D4D|nr:hypothetical protein [Soonwooa sp.]
MINIKLHEIENAEKLALLLENEDVTISVEKAFDISFLETINNANSDKEVSLNVSLNEHTPIEIWKNIFNVKRLLIHPSFEVQLENIDFLKNFKNLISLELSGDYTKKSLSFKPIEHVDTLVQFTFVRGLVNSNQYKFLNQQKKLEKLRIANIDLDLVTTNENLETLRVESVLKSENLISEKFPSLENLHLHSCSRLTNHNFLESFEKIERINISYNSHITEFPKMLNPELVKTIEMFTCPNFSSIDSLLQFKNLERLVLTSYDKPLQVAIQDFEKLMQLKKLTTVYTAWGKRPAKDLEFISEVYKKTKWKNAQ